ncbi:MAG: DUF58 domain-containing protein [Nitrospinae bacterium]|nr:DUF58 domain-containing protein [Nitrospinota bacterium]
MNPSPERHSSGLGQDEAAVTREMLRKIREVEIRARKVVNTLFSGEYHSAFKGRGMEFHESRPYQPGDDIRTMDWNVTARVGEPFVKVFREERELTLMILFDLSASGAFGSKENFKSETAAELCASLAFSAIRNNDKVGLIVFTGEVELYVPPRKGRSHVLRIIREILFFRPRGATTNIGSALDYMNLVARKKLIAFLVSDFRAEGYEKAVKATARKHDLIAIRMTDPMEKTMAPAGILSLRDAETGRAVYVDTSNKMFLDEYARAVRVEEEELSKFLNMVGVDHVTVDTGESYIEPLVKFFRQREKRRRGR